MPIEKLTEFAKDGQKNTDDLNLETGFIVNRKPARQWFNWLFNTLTLKINEIIDADFIPKSDVVDDLTTNDATKPVSAKQAKLLQDNKLDKNDLKDASTVQKGVVQLNNTLASTSTIEALTAAQGKALQDNKLEASKVGIAGGAASLGVDGYVPDDELKKASTTHTGIVQLVNDLVTGGTDKVLTAEQGKIINDKFNAVLGTTGHQKYLSGKIEQWGTVTFPPIASPISSNQTATFTFPFAFPNGVLHVFVTNNAGSGIEGNECTISVVSKTNLSAVLRAYRVAGDNTAGNEAFSASVFAIGW